MSHRSLPATRRLTVAVLALLAAPALALGCAKADQVSTGSGGSTGSTAGTTPVTTVPSESDAAGRTEPACFVQPGPDPKPEPMPEPMPAPTPASDLPLTTVPPTTVPLTTIPPSDVAGSGAIGGPSGDASESVANDCPDDPRGVHPTPKKRTPPTTCVGAPATTTPTPGAGGGELICSSPDDPVSSDPGAGDGGSASSPPMTAPSGEPEVPGMPPTLEPDATHGVVSGSTGGSPCPPSAEMCVAMYQLVPATIVVTPAAGGPPVTTVESDGGFAVLLAPGSYVLTATPTQDTDRVCPPMPVDVTAGATSSISIDCAKQG